MSVGRPLLQSSDDSGVPDCHLLKLSPHIPPISLMTSQDLSLETGGSLWEGSVCLSQYLIGGKNIFEDKVILELGSGCGLAGVTAAIIGAKLVILTDLPQQLPHLEANILLNRHLINTEIICVSFSFGQTFDDLVDALKTHPSHIVQDIISKRNSSFIDIVIGADIAYDVSLLTPLSTSLNSIVQSNQCVSYLVETVRWKDIYGWFLESLISPVDELEEGTEPCLALLEVIELYKGRHQSNHSSPILLSNGREEVNLINSFSRADVVLHIFVHNNTTSTSRLK